MKNNGVFTMIAANNEEFYSKDKRLNLLHLYIAERVRGFDACGKTCYISNEQFAKETNSSISTITRAIKLLTDLEILWAGYHQESVKNKQRILHIYDERLGAYHKAKIADSQNDNQRWSNCVPKIVKMTSSDGQNDQLVDKEYIKSKSLVTSSELSGALDVELTEEEQELLDMNMVTLEEILLEREPRPEYEREPEDLGSCYIGVEDLEDEDWI